MAISILRHVQRSFTKRRFDPKNKDDLRAYKHFLLTNSWGKDTCPFELEWPWLSVPDMLADRLAKHVLEKV